LLQNPRIDACARIRGDEREARGREVSDELRYERIGAAAVLTIDRPERRNAVDSATAELFRQGLRDFEADDAARALVLTGAGGVAFCAGADLKALDLNVDHPDGPMGPTRLTPSKPAIAAVDGWCLAGGVELALWCDLRIATPGSTFGLFERRWGVPLVDGGTQRLPRVVGMGRALELILTGRPVDAEEAHRIGLVNEVVEAGRHLERALELAEKIASFPQETMLADRRAAIEGFGLPLDEGLALEHRLGREVLEVAVRGAARFAAGEGRGGAGV
jgi:enoyl-CoA hydratase